MKILSFIICLAFLFSCNQSGKKQNSDKAPIVYDMYEPSEMAILMNEMYDYNLAIKKEIQ